MQPSIKAQKINTFHIDKMMPNDDDDDFFANALFEI